MDHQAITETFNRLDWTPDQINGLESSLLNSNQVSVCTFTADIYGNGVNETYFNVLLECKFYYIYNNQQNLFVT